MSSKPPASSLRDAGAGERIAKLLARAGVASRREVERMIADGRVARDGVAIETPATLLASLAGITVDGEPVAAPAAARLFIYHKPIGLLVTEWDPAGRATIYDRLPPELPRVVPVGRLDLGTEGLLLLTTDGGLKRQLELPATGVERTYRARAYGPVSQEQLEELIHGIEIEGIRYGPIDANLERRTGANSWIELTLTEGKNREVRRVLEYLGLEVSRLIRTRYGPFVLADMPAGEVGEVRQHDLESFRKTLKLSGGKTAGDMEAVTAQPLPKPVAIPMPEPQPAVRRQPASPRQPAATRSQVLARQRAPDRREERGPATGSRRTERSARFADERAPSPGGERGANVRPARATAAADKPRGSPQRAGKLRAESPDRERQRPAGKPGTASTERERRREPSPSGKPPTRSAADRGTSPTRPTRGPAGSRGKPGAPPRSGSPRGKR